MWKLALKLFSRPSKTSTGGAFIVFTYDRTNTGIRYQNIIPTIRSAKTMQIDEATVLVCDWKLNHANRYSYMLDWILSQPVLFTNKCPTEGRTRAGFSLLLKYFMLWSVSLEAHKIQSRHRKTKSWWLTSSCLSLWYVFSCFQDGWLLVRWNSPNERKFNVLVFLKHSISHLISQEIGGLHSSLALCTQFHFHQIPIFEATLGPRCSISYPPKLDRWLCRLKGVTSSNWMASNLLSIAWLSW